MIFFIDMLFTKFSLMKVLLRGPPVISSKLIQRLLSEGHSVICLDNLLYGPLPLLSSISHPKLELVIGDARDKSILEPLISQSDVIIPLACMTGAPLCDKDKLAAVTVNRDAVVLCSELSSNSQLIIYPCTNSGYGVGQDGIFVMNRVH